jgi:hypothetical protein
MQVVQTYMVSVYHGGLLEFLRVMGRLLPGRTRRSGIDFAANIAALDDIADRVREFDRSFSPEADDGKTFYRFRHTSSERDAAQTSAFKALIKQKNRDATLILEKFNDQLRSLYQAGQVIKKGSYSDLNERYRDFESTSASARPFDDRLDRMLHTIENTEKILNQMTRIDREE